MAQADPESARELWVHIRGLTRGAPDEGGLRYAMPRRLAGTIGRGEQSVSRAPSACGHLRLPWCGRTGRKRTWRRDDQHPQRAAEPSIHAIRSAPDKRRRDVLTAVPAAAGDATPTSGGRPHHGAFATSGTLGQVSRPRRDRPSVCYWRQTKTCLRGGRPCCLARRWCGSGSPQYQRPGR